MIFFPSKAEENFKEQPNIEEKIMELIKTKDLILSFPSSSFYNSLNSTRH